MDENFFQRWSRRKTEHAQEQDSAARLPLKNEPVQDESAEDGKKNGMASEPGGAVLPTLEDIAQLNSDSDYSLFISKGVDKAVRRAALKKLFSDPHFNVMDRLDIYIDDYNKPSPMSAAMLAALNHTKTVFGPVADSEKEQEVHKEGTVGDMKADEETQASDMLSRDEEGSNCNCLPADAAIEKDQIMQTSPLNQDHRNIASESENLPSSSSDQA